jgi:hypothetical protein
MPERELPTHTPPQPTETPKNHFTDRLRFPLSFYLCLAGLVCLGSLVALGVVYYLVKRRDEI